MRLLEQKKVTLGVLSSNTKYQPSEHHDPPKALKPRGSRARAAAAGGLSGGFQMPTPGRTTCPGPSQRPSQAPGEGGPSDTALPVPTAEGKTRLSPDSNYSGTARESFPGRAPRAPRWHHPRGRDSRAQVGRAAAPRPEDAGFSGRLSRAAAGPRTAARYPRPPRPRRLPRSSLRGRRRPRPCRGARWPLPPCRPRPPGPRPGSRAAPPPGRPCRRSRRRGPHRSRRRLPAYSSGAWPRAWRRTGSWRAAGGEGGEPEAAAESSGRPRAGGAARSRLRAGGEGRAGGGCREAAGREE